MSGQRLIRMDVLKEIYEGLHLMNVRTYIQSGNVIFKAKKTVCKDLESIISRQIQKILGFEVPVLVLEMGDLKNIIGRNPYKDDKTKDITFLHVTFLRATPEQIDFKTIYQKKSPGEEVAIIERAVYLYCPNGYGKTKLTNTFFENRLKVGATTRNWGTTLELLNLAENN